jgi:hypothetical protein
VKVQEYNHGGPLPVTGETVAVPLQDPKHEILVPEIFITGPVVLATAIVSILIHPFASFTVSIYTPAHNPVMVAVVAPVLQK